MGITLYRNLVAPSSVPATAFTIIQCPAGTSPVSDSIADTLTFALGASGTDFNISGDSTTDTVTFNIPNASATARGLITTGTQTIAGQKTFNAGPILNVGCSIPDYDRGVTFGPGNEFTIDVDSTSLQLEFIDNNVDASDGWNFIRNDLIVGTYSMLKMTSTGVVFNDDSKDLDFRIEGDTDGNLFVCDAGNSRVGIGVLSPTSKLDVAGNVLIDGRTNVIQLTVQGNATQSALLSVWEDSFGLDVITFAVSGAAVFNEAGNSADFRIESNVNTHMFYLSGGSDFISINSSSKIALFGIAGSVDEIQFAVRAHTSQTALLSVWEDKSGNDVITFGALGQAVFNENANDADFRIESDTDTHNFFSDGGVNRIGIGQSSPAQKLDVLGDVILGAASGSQGSRILGRGEHTSAPAGSLATGEWELSVYDDGATPVFRVRYNDGGSVKTADLTLA